MNERIRQVVAETRALVEQAYGPRLEGVILYGSQARGEATEGSDVDLLIVLRGEVSAGTEIRRMSKALSELSLRHDLVVSCVFVSEQQYRTERTPFLLNVRREGVAA
jgi:predicted nucleotidyltransferase